MEQYEKYENIEAGVYIDKDGTEMTIRKEVSPAMPAYWYFVDRIEQGGYYRTGDYNVDIARSTYQPSML